MKTPNKNQIVERASELWKIDRVRANDPSFDLTPEIEELEEGGFLCAARSDLMRSSESKNAELLKEVEGLETLNFKEALANGLYTSGTRGCGKSDLNMLIAEKLISEGVIVVVFDPSTDWKTRSSIQKYVVVQPCAQIEIPRESLIYDLSVLTIAQQKRFVENFNRELFDHQIKNKSDQWYFCIYEESHQYFPQGCMRAKAFEYSVRLLTQGRNFKISMALVTQFSSMLDKDCMKFMCQRFFGASNEANDIRYLKGFLGKDATSLKTLEAGEFFYFNRGRISKIQIDSFENFEEKTQIVALEKPIHPMPNQEYAALAALLRLGVVLMLIIVVVGSLRR